nr:EOG090X0AGI [Simocephalus serrulatus]
MAVSTSVRTIREAWSQLHGVLCVYKPNRICSNRLRSMIINNICRDINQLEQTPPRTFVKIEPVIGYVESGVPTAYTVTSVPNLTDHELVRGPAILHEDISLGWANTLGKRSSGVMVFGLNKGNRNVKNFVLSRPTSVYHVRGQFGLATDNHWDDGKVWEKSTYVHLTRDKLNRLLSTIQATNQKKMFQYCGVDPNSQTAYELASQGLLRPAAKGPPLIYAIKCIKFEPPNFTLEIHCVNENEDYFSQFIHDLGLSLRTNAVCEQIRCIRYGCFTVEDALLRKHWSLEHLPDHMSMCHLKLKSLPAIGPQLAAYERLQSLTPKQQNKQV